MDDAPDPTLRKKVEYLREMRQKSALGGGEVRIAEQHAKGKLTARERLNLLLDELEIIGIPTTIPLHQAIMVDRQFNAGDFTTTYLDTFTLRLNEQLARVEENAAALAAANRRITIPLKRAYPHRSNWRRFDRLHTDRPGW